MSAKTKSLEDILDQQLQDPVFAASYLNEVFSDSESTIEEMLLALKDVVRARGVSSIAEKSGIPREHLYTVLSPNGNPTLSTLKAVFDALNLSLSVKQTAA